MRLTNQLFNMRFLILLLLIPVTYSAQQDSAYINTVLKHREEVNKEFGDTAKSPLPDEMAIEFEHLNYFEPNEKYRIEAKFKKKIGPVFEMTTSAGKLKKFRQYGILKFKLDGKKFKLPIYQNMRLLQMPMYRDYVFIPFNDLTNEEESYGGGRYIEAKLPKDKTYILDFNYAFNPYCHYTTGYNCPIPPKDNFLDIRIEAGEKKFDEDH